MLVQSGSGKVYAVLADNPIYELAIMPNLQVISTSVFLMLRCRYKVRTQGAQFDPMLVPKRVLAGGIERSGNTLRSNAVLNTGFSIEKVGSGFPSLMAKKVYESAVAHYVTYDASEAPAAEGFLTHHNLREDFHKDFAGLVESCIGPIYPAKDFTPVPLLTTQFNFAMAMENVNDKHTGLHSVPETTEDSAFENVAKVDFGSKVDKPH